MDLGYYVTALLEQHGTIYVPGLGVFARVKANGYYDDSAARFYPPTVKLDFSEQEQPTDNVLASFISQEKSISQPSARYFIERFVNDLRNTISVREYQVGALGHLFTDGTKLLFRATGSGSLGGAYFGLPSFEQYKIGQQPAVVAQPLSDPAIIVAPVAEPAVDAPATLSKPEKVVLSTPEQVVSSTPEPEVEQWEEPAVKKPKLWLAIVAIVVLLAAAAGALYIYKPTLFGAYPEQKPLPAPDLDAPSEETIQPDTPKVDSSAPKDNIADTDTIGTQKADLNQGETQTVITPAAPEVKAANANGRSYPYWVIILDAYKTTKRADKALAHYNRLGVKAYILDEKNYGSLKKIVIGPFSSKEGSDAKRKELIGLKKIQKESYSREIKKIP